MKKKILSIITAIVMFLAITGFTTESGVKKNETVYVILNYDGSVKDKRVVNWVRGIDESSKWTDYGEYLKISNMISGDKPKVEGDKIIWPMTVLETGGLYYQGVTDKDLPVGISIRYYLDGKTIKGEELSGKSGNLKIHIKIKNKLRQDQPISYIGYGNIQKENKDKYYVPLLVQISLKVDLDIFSDISAEDASKVVVGREMNIGFGTFPYPEEEFTIEMKGENIELAPINIVVVPQNLPLPDIGDAEEDFIEMADSLEEMKDGADEMIDGLDEMLDEANEFKDVTQDLVDAISEINHGAYELNNNSSDIGNGIKELTGGLDTLKDESETLASGINVIQQNTDFIGTGISQSAAGAGDLAASIGPLSEGLVTFQAGHGDLTALAEAILAAYPDTPENAQIRALAQGVIDEQAAIAGFVMGIQGINAGAVVLSSGLTELSGNFSAYSNGINEIASGTGALPGGIGQLADGVRELHDGWHEYSDGVSELYDGTQEFYDETINFPDDVNKLVDGIEKIKDAIEELINEGIIEMKDGVIEGIDDVKFGKAMKEKVDELAEGYNSFIDNDKNLNSEVQFIMQTEEIKIDESIKTTAEESTEEIGFFQRFLALFKR